MTNSEQLLLTKRSTWGDVGQIALDFTPVGSAMDTFGNAKSMIGSLGEGRYGAALWDGAKMLGNAAMTGAGMFMPVGGIVRGGAKLIGRGLSHMAPKAITGAAAFAKAPKFTTMSLPWTKATMGWGGKQVSRFATPVTTAGKWAGNTVDGAFKGGQWVLNKTRFGKPLQNNQGKIMAGGMATSFGEMGYDAHQASKAQEAFRGQQRFGNFQNAYSNMMNTMPLRDPRYITPNSNLDFSQIARQVPSMLGAGFTGSF